MSPFPLGKQCQSSSPNTFAGLGIEHGYKGFERRRIARPRYSALSVYIAAGAMKGFTVAIAATSAIAAAAAEDFNILQHVGGNGQWFPGML